MSEALTELAYLDFTKSSYLFSATFRRRERERERERERSNSKTLFSKDCSSGSFRPVLNYKRERERSRVENRRETYTLNSVQSPSI